MELKTKILLLFLTSAYGKEWTELIGPHCRVLKARSLRWSLKLLLQLTLREKSTSIIMYSTKYCILKYGYRIMYIHLWKGTYFYDGWGGGIANTTDSDYECTFSWSSFQYSRNSEILFFLCVILLAYDVSIIFPDFALRVTVNRKLPFRNIQLNFKLNCDISVNLCF